MLAELLIAAAAAAAAGIRSFVRWFLFLAVRSYIWLYLLPVYYTFCASINEFVYVENTFFGQEKKKKHQRPTHHFTIGSSHDQYRSTINTSILVSIVVMSHIPVSDTYRRREPGSWRGYWCYYTTRTADQLVEQNFSMNNMKQLHTHHTKVFSNLNV